MLVFLFLLLTQTIWILAEDCTYPSYLKGKWRIDDVQGHEVEYTDNTLFGEGGDDILRNRITWKCFKSLEEGEHQLIISRLKLFGRLYYRCELYHKADNENVYYKKLTDPFDSLVDDTSDSCNYCGHKDNVETLPNYLLHKTSAEGSPAKLPTNEWGCDPDTKCDECRATTVQGEDTEALQDARSLDLILRQWLMDTRKRG